MKIVKTESFLGDVIKKDLANKISKLNPAKIFL
jgi:hypothetical protein